MSRRRSRYETVPLKPAEPVASFDDWRGIWVIAEILDGELRDVTRELLGAGRPMADKLKVPLTAILLCDKPGRMATELIAHGADEVIIVADPWLKTPLARPSADVLTELINDRKPEIVLIGATHTGRDISSRIAVTVEAGMTADCTELDVEPGSRELLARRPAFGGKMLATIRCDRHRPQMATARPGIFVPLPKDAKRKGERVKAKPACLKDAQYAAEVLDYVVDTGVDITKEEVLVAGGMGVGGPAGFKKLEELAAALGGDVACSRPVADEGWVERSRQVGQTGVSVRPKLYIAVGISGAIQHIEGMKESGTVIAINQDPNAAIFQYADIGLVGDWKGHVDALISEAKKRKLDAVKWMVPAKDTLDADRQAATERAQKAAGKPADAAKPAESPADTNGKTEAPANGAPEAVEAEEAAKPAAGVPKYDGDPNDAAAVKAWVKENVPEEKKAWVIAADCIVCNGCDAACPTGAAVVEDIAMVDRDLCIADGACFDACPTDAIRPGIEDPATTAGWPPGSRLAA